MNKPEILNLLQEKLKFKIDYLGNLIAETRASNNETKSSMGDKYETTREMVQQEINNISGSMHPDELLSKWRDGYQIDYRKLYGINNESAHQELPLTLIRRVSTD